MNHAPFYRATAVQAEAAEASVWLRSPVTDEWVVLGGAARRIWERLDYAASAEELAAALSAEFDASAEEIEGAVAGTLAELDRHGLVAETPGSGRDRPRDRYLSLLKRALVNRLYPEMELQIAHLERGADGLSGVELQRFQRDIAEREPDRFAELMAGKLNGTGPLRYAHTMIGHLRLSNIERCAEQVIAERVPGDFLEAGVCKGGAAIFMRALQVAHGADDRKTFVVDSFEGLPPSDLPRDAAYGLHLEEARFPWLACSEETVREHFSRYDLLDSNVEFVKGWLAQSLPNSAIGELALLRIDVDLYSSTLECLDLLYDKVVDGGFVIVDDYGFLQCCRDAVDEFRSRRGVSEPVRWIDRSGIFWRKESS